MKRYLLSYLLLPVCMVLPTVGIASECCAPAEHCGPVQCYEPVQSCPLHCGEADEYYAPQQQQQYCDCEQESCCSNSSLFNFDWLKTKMGWMKEKMACIGLDLDQLSPFSVNARIAYYSPDSKRVRRIYGNGWADYQLEFLSNYGNNWQFWTGVSGFSKRGRSIGLQDRTRITLLPISLGLKYLIDTPDFLSCYIGNDLRFYVGGGVIYSWLRIHDHSRYVREHTRKEEFGGIGQIGAYYNINECLFVNGFFDYMYQRFDRNHRHHSDYVERRELNISGYKTGVGIGLMF